MRHRPDEPVDLTTSDAGDSLASRGPLLDQVKEAVASAGWTAGEACTGVVAKNHPAAGMVVPRRRDTVPSEAAGPCRPSAASALVWRVGHVAPPDRIDRGCAQRAPDTVGRLGDVPPRLAQTRPWRAGLA